MYPDCWMDGSPLLQAILADGIVGGVGAVVGFLPLVMVMYFLIALLEDCGYMARVSVVMDPIFKRVGLSGKSIIPIIIGTGCGIPGIMASRTIRDERERRATAMLTTFMPCGAKIPVIALFAGAFFAGSSWVGPANVLCRYPADLPGRFAHQVDHWLQIQKILLYHGAAELQDPKPEESLLLHAGTC